MSTTPAPLPAAPKPTAPVAAPEKTVVPTDATIGSDITWIRTHILVSLLAIALIAGSIIGGIGLFESLIEKHDARVAAAQIQKEGVDTATQSTLLAQLAQDRASDVARDTAQTALITSLVAQMKQQHAVTNAQVVTDATLDAQAAAIRLATQTKAGPGDVTATNDTVTLSLPITRTVVANLDLLPQAQSDVTNLQSQLNAQQTLTSDAQVEAAAANKVIDADKTELLATVTADNAACKVQVDTQMKKDRKSKWHYFIAGFATGFGVRQIIKSTTGI